MLFFSLSMLFKTMQWFIHFPCIITSLAFDHNVIILFSDHEQKHQPAPVLKVVSEVEKVFFRSRKKIHPKPKQRMIDNKYGFMYLVNKQGLLLAAILRHIKMWCFLPQMKLLMDPNMLNPEKSFYIINVVDFSFCFNTHFLRMILKFFIFYQSKRKVNSLNDRELWQTG